MNQQTPWILFFTMIAIAAALIVACATPNDESYVGEEFTPSTYIYPHEVGWNDYSNHGIYALEEGIATCEQCHGDDYKGGSSEVSCYACHGVFPHTAGWSAIQNHGVYVDEHYGPNTCATACHGKDLLGGDSGVSCYQCHDKYPHRSDWMSTHGEALEFSDYEGCATACHGTDMKGGYSGVSCLTCHPGE